MLFSNSYSREPLLLVWSALVLFAFLLFPLLHGHFTRHQRFVLAAWILPLSFLIFIGFIFRKPAANAIAGMAAFIPFGLAIHWWYQDRHDPPSSR
ncbi:MAG: hypothetical protein OWS74_07550 [Firmicutes bacterium]|nr:hypothetical protein [Bacillota bacterium]